MEAIDVQYFLARTLESVGQIAEAATLYRRIAQMNPRFKDAAYRAKELSSKQKHPTNGNGGLRATGPGSAMPSRVSTSLSVVASSGFAIYTLRSTLTAFDLTLPRLCNAFEYLLDSRQRFPSHDGKRIVGIGRRTHSIQNTGDARRTRQDPQGFS